MIWVLALAAFYVALFVFKLYKSENAERLYEKYGLDIGLFQLRFSWTANGRWVTNIPTIRRTKKWFKFGAVISGLLLLPSTLFLVWNLVKLLAIISSANSDIQSVLTTEPQQQGALPPVPPLSPSATSQSNLEVNSDSLIFQPVIPGYNFPLKAVGYYGFSLFASTLFHEFGHALAADCHDVKILGYGVMVIFIIPAAFVSLSTPEFQSVGNFEQLKINTAGIWHNLVLALFTTVMLFALPYLLTPLFDRGGIAGLTVLEIDEKSSVNGASGLTRGDVLFESINGCQFDGIGAFFRCLRKLSKDDQTGVCIQQSLVEDLKNTHLNGDDADCCVANVTGSSLCFEAVNHDHPDLKHCLPARQVMQQKKGFCNEVDRIESCGGETEKCLVPLMSHDSEKLLQIRRRGDKDFLFIGAPSEVSRAILEITDYVPKFDFIPVNLPVVLEKTCYFITSFSLALALINVVPCAMLDGQHVITSLFRIFIPSCSSSALLSKIFVSTGSILLLANILLTLYVIQTK